MDARIDISCVYKLGDHARQPCDKTLKNDHSVSCILPLLKTSLFFSLNTFFPSSSRHFFLILQIRSKRFFYLSKLVLVFSLLRFFLWFSYAFLSPVYHTFSFSDTYCCLLSSTTSFSCITIFKKILFIKQVCSKRWTPHSKGRRKAAHLITMFRRYILHHDSVVREVNGGGRWAATMMWRVLGTIMHQHDSSLRVPLECSSCIKGVFWNTRIHLHMYCFPNNRA